MQHLEEASLSYFAHMQQAFSFSFLCFRASIKACVHGFFPGFFSDASEEVAEWFEEGEWFD